MTTVGVVTDSCAGIPEELIEGLGIEVVPYYIHRGKETLRDLVDVQRREFFEWLATAKELPKTANPSAGDFLEAYKKVAERTKGIVSIHMTSWGSGAYQSATVASEMLKQTHPEARVEVIDTKQTAMGYGYMAVEAARAALAGKSLDEVVELVRGMIPKMTMIQTADTLRYLYMGGRIGRAQHLVGSLLNIKPLIGMEDGVVVPLGQARSRRKAYEKMVEMMEERLGLGAKIKVAFTHVAALEEVEKLRAMVESRFSCQEVLISELSPALGVHAGPGMTGVCFFPVE